MKKLLFISLLCYASINATLKLISPTFLHNQEIPPQYSCEGKNISPALAWSDAPEGTQSFALIVEDPDVSTITSAKKANEKPKTWVHWILFNIPATVEHIIENQGSEGEEVPFMQGATDFNAIQKWSGPCPPVGVHHYHFTLYALDTILDVPAGATREQLLSSMNGHILEKTTLIGTYQRKK